MQRDGSITKSNNIEKDVKKANDVIDQYEVKPNVEYFLTIFVVGELSVIISTVLPMMYLSSLKPKEIML